MNRWREIRNAVAITLAVVLACTPTYGLVTLNDSHDHINVSTSFGVSRDSNIFASSDNEGDAIYSTSLGVTYQRRAGWIGVNGSVSMGASRFGKHTEENFSNPSYALELSKQSGRTTGAFTLSAARESRADAAVNLRSTSWNYNAGLNFRYPIKARTTLTGGFGFSGHYYTDTNTLSNLATYSTNADLIYLLPQERDLIAGYRYRLSNTSRDTSFSDHSLSAGVNGRLIAGLNGSVRAGVQARVPHGKTTAGEGTFYSWTGSSSVTYPINRKISLSGSVAKDFSTTATDSSVDSLNVGLNGQYAYNRRWSFTADVGWGDSRFLGEQGRVVLATAPTLILGPNRRDDFLNWSANLNYARSEHLKIAFSYSWFENWSTNSFADFIRTTWSLNLSSSW